MKRSLLCFGLALLSASVLRADLVVVQKIDGIGHTGEMTMKIKEGKMRVDVSPEMSAITDLGTGTVTTLMHSQKAYMQIDGDMTRKLMERFQKMKGAPKNDAEEGPAKPQPTGKHETINGFNTEIFTYQSGKTQMMFWIAKDFPQADKFQAAFKQLQNSPMAAMARKMGRQPTDFPGVPVKTEVLDPSGAAKITTTILSVKEQALDASEFAIPADYKGMTMPSFGEGMPGGARGHRPPGGDNAPEPAPEQ